MTGDYFAMKKSLKFLSSLLTFGICLTLNSNIIAAEKNDPENFNFIKSEEVTDSFIYDGSLLLYGGIALISISIAGITFTLLPSRKRLKTRREKQGKKL